MNKWIVNWFSNFSPFDVPFEYQGMVFDTPEHFYQAMKCDKDDLDGRLKIASAKTPGLSKRIGRGVRLRNDWEEIKEDVMKLALEYKFASGTSWHNKLVGTGDELIVERNNWHDNEWGDCVCSRCKSKPGKNMLGRILMDIRKKG